jgi:hypothetical protein
MLILIVLMSSRELLIKAHQERWNWSTRWLCLRYIPSHLVFCTLRLGAGLFILFTVNILVILG